MTSVRKATAADSRAVYDLLSGSSLINSGLPFGRRDRLTRPIWGGAEEHFGYVLTDDDGTLHGFLGTLFTEREIAGERRRFCELHSWYVDDAHRNEGFGLFMAAMSAKRVTFLNHTPSAGVHEIGTKFGFTDLETEVLVVPPVPTPRSLRRDFHVETSPDAIAERLTGADRQILDDHRDIPECLHVLLTHRRTGAVLYLIAKRMRRHRFEPIGRILHISDENAFVDAVDRLRIVLPARLGVLYLMLDKALLKDPGAIRFTLTVDRPVPSQFKSRHLTADDVRTSLYSEPLLVGYRLH